MLRTVCLEVIMHCTNWKSVFEHRYLKPKIVPRTELYIKWLILSCPLLFFFFGHFDKLTHYLQTWFHFVGSIAHVNAYFGRGTGGIYLDDLGCRGNESRLIDCSHNVIGVHNCDHSDDAGIRCQRKNIPIRKSMINLAWDFQPGFKNDAFGRSQTRGCSLEVLI